MSSDAERMPKRKREAFLNALVYAVVDRRLTAGSERAFTSGQQIGGMSPEKSQIKTKRIRISMTAWNVLNAPYGGLALKHNKIASEVASKLVRTLDVGTIQRHQSNFPKRLTPKKCKRFISYNENNAHVGGVARINKVLSKWAKY